MHRFIGRWLNWCAPGLPQELGSEAEAPTQAVCSLCSVSWRSSLAALMPRVSVKLRLDAAIL